METVKESVLELAKRLSDDCSWDDVMYQIYVRQKITAGLKHADEGRVAEHDEVFKELEQ